jgi:hypothetical protein
MSKTKPLTLDQLKELAEITTDAIESAKDQWRSRMRGKGSLDFENLLDSESN